MSYIGNQPFTAAFLTDQFSGNGSTVAFTLSAAPANTNSIIVAVSGVLQDPSTYSVSGTTLTFSAAPPAGTGNISVRFLGIPASGVVNTAYRTVTEFTATAGQTTFSVPSYTPGFIDVYRNGALLGSADFTATNGTTVVLAAGASAGDLVETVSFSVSSVLNAIPAQNNAVIDSYILSMAGSKLTGSQSIPRAALPTGSVLQVVQATTQSAVSNSTTTYADSGLSATITPTSASSRILVLISQSFYININPGSSQYGGFQVVRNTTPIYTPSQDVTSSFDYGISTGGSVSALYNRYPVSYLDSPATTSATTYKTQMRVYFTSSGGVIFAQNANGTSSIVLMEIAG